MLMTKMKQLIFSTIRFQVFLAIWKFVSFMLLVACILQSWMGSCHLWALTSITPAQCWYCLKQWDSDGSMSKSGVELPAPLSPGCRNTMSDFCLCSVLWTIPKVVRCKSANFNCLGSLTWAMSLLSNSTWQENLNTPIALPKGPIYQQWITYEIWELMVLDSVVSGVKLACSCQSCQGV